MPFGECCRRNRTRTITYPAPLPPEQISSSRAWCSCSWSKIDATHTLNMEAAQLLGERRTGKRDEMPTLVVALHMPCDGVSSGSHSRSRPVQDGLRIIC